MCIVWPKCWFCCQVQRDNKTEEMGWTISKEFLLTTGLHYLHHVADSEHKVDVYRYAIFYINKCSLIFNTIESLQSLFKNNIAKFKLYNVIKLPRFLTACCSHVDNNKHDNNCINDALILYLPIIKDEGNDNISHIATIFTYINFNQPINSLYQPVALLKLYTNLLY